MTRRRRELFVFLFHNNLFERESYMSFVEYSFLSASLLNLIKTAKPIYFFKVIKFDNFNSLIFYLHMHS